MPCYTIKDPNFGTMFLCGKFGPHCRGGCGAPGDEFLCDWPVGKGKTCDAPLCADHAHEVAPEVHYCPGHFAEWEKYRNAGGVAKELANVVPFARPGRPPAVPALVDFYSGQLGEPVAEPPVREITRPASTQRDLFDDGPDLNTMSRPARAAAMKGGTAGWGQVGSASAHVRYGELMPPRPGKRRACYCGCDGPVTHVGKANGIALTSACELGIARWVKTGHVRGNR